MTAPAVTLVAPFVGTLDPSDALVVQATGNALVLIVITVVQGAAAAPELVYRTGSGLSDPYALSDVEAIDGGFEFDLICAGWQGPLVTLAVAIVDSFGVVAYGNFSWLAPTPPPPAVATYRMRGFDQTLARYVYWDSISLDAAGADYAGPGPLADIVVQKLSGA